MYNCVCDCLQRLIGQVVSKLKTDASSRMLLEDNEVVEMLSANKDIIDYCTVNGDPALTRFRGW